MSQVIAFGTEMMHTQIKLTLEKIISFPQFVGFFALGWDFFFGFGIFFSSEKNEGVRD